MPLETPKSIPKHAGFYQPRVISGEKWISGFGGGVLYLRFSSLDLLNDDSFFFFFFLLCSCYCDTGSFGDGILLSLGFSPFWRVCFFQERWHFTFSLSELRHHFLFLLGFSLLVTTVSFLYPLNFLCISWGISAHIQLANLRNCKPRSVLLILTCRKCW